MKLQFRRSFILGVLAATGLACAAKPPPGTALIQMPWPDSEGVYSLQAVAVPTLNNTKTMQGAAATIKIHAGPNGPQPEANFVVDGDGVLIPGDYLTLQMSVAYAHLEKLMFIEQRLGLDALLPRPRKITIEYPMYDESGAAVFDNAFYYPTWDSLVLLPYRRRELPITVNAGILAHEHFHAIFQHTLGSAPAAAELHGLEISWAELPSVSCGEDMKREVSARAVGKPAGRNAPMVILRALNEGLADFWGWYYTRDENFIAHSLPHAGPTRRVVSQLKTLPDEKFFEAISRVEDTRTLLTTAYCLGTYFSRFARRLADVEGADEVAGRLLRNLIRMRSQSQIKVKPDLVLSLFFASSSELTPSRCTMIKDFTAALTDSALSKACEVPQP
ncbi:MAG TPA: hypothetical protein VFV50_10060 [Bdellovibrionales bacterium]|nr:hypothetical protein [Bdellovibrionales bacterium]